MPPTSRLHDLLAERFTAPELRQLVARDESLAAARLGDAVNFDRAVRQVAFDLVEAASQRNLLATLALAAARTRQQVPEAAELARLFTAADCKVRARLKEGTADDLFGAPATAPTPFGQSNLESMPVGRPSEPDFGRHDVPSMAPRDLPHFVGRTKEMALLEDQLLQSSGSDIVIISLVGVGGVGKSALAAHFAKVHRRHFPGGIFWAYVDRQTPGDLARCIATILGIDQQVDSQYDDQQARCAIQRLLMNRRALLILDNADGEEATDRVLNMLPTEDSVSVLITTRNKNLISKLGASMVELEGFRPDESLALFRKVLPDHDARWHDRTGDVQAMIQELGGLPLATDITAQFLARRVDIPFRDYCAYLRQPGTVSNLSSGNKSVAEIVIEKSMSLLTPPNQAAFVALGACAESGFSVETAREVARLPVQGGIESLLDKLIELSLLQVHSPGRFRLHPVVRACVRARPPTAEADRRHLIRWCDYVKRYARDRSADWGALTQEWDGIRTAWDWCLREVNKLSDQAQVSPDAELTCVSAVTIADSLRYFLDGRGYWTETLARMPTCLRAAVLLRNSEFEFRIRRHFALLLRKAGRYQDAEQENQRNIEHAKRAERLDWRGMELEQLGRIRVRQERYDEAQRLYYEALAIAQASPHGEKYVRQCLNCLGELALRQRQPRRAVSDFQRAYSLYVLAGETQGIGASLAHLGDALLELGESDRALAHYVEAIRVFSNPGKVDLHASNFLRLGVVLEKQGERGLALACYVVSATTCEWLGISELRGRSPAKERTRLLAELGPEGERFRVTSSRQPEEMFKLAQQTVLEFVASRPALADIEPAYQHPLRRLPSIGFIGLGRMGRPLAESLLRGGCRLTFTNRQQQIIDDMRSLGALHVESPADVARMSEVIFTMLRADQDVRDVILGEVGILAGARSGQLLIDMTTTHPQTIKEVASVAAAHGVTVIDAPVNGDVREAKDRKATILVGGDRDAFLRALPLLEIMTPNVFHMGPLGMGQTAKLCHQLLAGGIMAIYSTVLSLGRAAGVDPTTLAKVIEPFATAAMLNERLRNLVERIPFPPEALVVDVMVRDMTAASTLAKQLHFTAPVLDTIRQVYQDAAKQGRGSEDISSLPTP